MASASKLLEAYGVPVETPVLATSPADARDVAARLRYPVALKTGSPEVVHKTDVGGVRLQLVDETELLSAVREMDAEPMYVQRMAGKGQDVIVGCIRDAQFGPLMMFGSGGTQAEGLRDVAFALAPVSADDVDHLLTATWAGRRLAGVRGSNPGDRDALVDTMLRVGQLMVENPAISELEINPLRVFERGQGVLALDARVRQTCENPSQNDARLEDDSPHA
jgi:acyl-CoA synthetase (NDP forming)